MITIIENLNKFAPFKISLPVFLIISLVFVYFIFKIPFLGKYLRVYYTLIHEAGHAFAALITSGKVLNIELFSDTSGTTVTQSKSKFAAFLVSFAGYPFATAFAYLSFYLLINNQTKTLLIINLSILILVLVFCIRNNYGLFWMITAICLMLFFYLRQKQIEILILEFLLSIILVVESLSSGIALLQIAFSNPDNAGDATNLKKSSGISSLFWALLFFCITLYVSYSIYILLTIN